MANTTTVEAREADARRAEVFEVAQLWQDHILSIELPKQGKKEDPGHLRERRDLEEALAQRPGSESCRLANYDTARCL